MLLRRSRYSGLLPASESEMPAFVSLPQLCGQVVTISENMQRAGLPAKSSFHRLAALPAWRRCVQSAQPVGDETRETDVPGEAWGEIDAPLVDAIDEMNDQIEMSPQPAGEWGPVIDSLGEDLLAQLLSTSPSSIRRYANKSRHTPQDIAERLHYLALVLADLAGSYNSFGIRRWFARPRSALGGQSPADFLGRDFDIDDKPAATVARLASSLTGAGAT